MNDNTTQARELAKELGEKISAIFPRSAVNSRLTNGLGKFILIDFTLGAKGEWKNGIPENDCAKCSIFIWLNDDGSLPTIVEVHSDNCGSISIKAKDQRYAYERAKTGWRNFKGDRATVVKRIPAYFKKLKQVIKDNIVNLDQFDANIATNKVN